MYIQLKTYSKLVFISFVCVLLLGTVFAGDFTPFVGVDSQYDIKRMLVVFFICLSSLGLCFVKEVEFIRVSKVTASFLGIFLSLAILSALYSKHPFWGMLEIANMGLLLCAFLIFTTSIKALNREKFFLGLYLCALLFSIFTFIKYILFLLFSYADAQSFDIHGLISGYANVRFFNQLQVMVIPLLFLPYFCQNLTKFKRFLFIVLSLHWLVLLQTQARGGMLSLILASSLIAFFLSQHTRQQFISIVLKTIMAGVVLWLVFIIAIPHWLMESSNFQLRTTSSGRVDLWLYILTHIPESLWLGFGPMSFTWAEAKPLPHAHPHNLIMQILYEYGAISCVAFTAWCVNRLYSRLDSIQQQTIPGITPIVFAVLSGLICSLFSGVAVMPFAQLALVFLVAILAQFDSCHVYKAALHTRVVLFVSVVLMGSLLFMTYKSDELLSALFPRIWVNGLISY
ncbi:O-antigen ligase family protein [Shewanella sp. 10N.286.52.C2]|uniref:O-antigen ligase family protein n=1 Tax=Shewanella sp. 10N.286.52.C2 TaxID=1880838 RepID=UPI001F531BE4|nr:O-antigen ligase family protein [Shewanella sp. 10N.286.52.C2]